MNISIMEAVQVNIACIYNSSGLNSGMYKYMAVNNTGRAITKDVNNDI